LGVDDYLIKPVQPQDLLATVHGRLQRAQQIAEACPQRPPRRAGVIDLGRLQVDSGQYRAWLDGKRVHLSAREFRLLECLSQRVNSVVTLEELVRVTHELNVDKVEAGTLLRPLIRSLRRKLGYPAGDMGCIESVRGVGYRLLHLPHLDEGGLECSEKNP
jgi:DNA-binding response OmpR family regulator